MPLNLFLVKIANIHVRFYTDSQKNRQIVLIICYFKNRKYRLQLTICYKSTILFCHY